MSHHYATLPVDLRTTTEPYKVDRLGEVIRRAYAELVQGTGAAREGKFSVSVHYDTFSGLHSVTVTQP